MAFQDQAALNGELEEALEVKKEAAEQENKEVASGAIDINLQPPSSEKLPQQNLLRPRFVQLKLHRINEEKLQNYLGARADLENALSLRYKLLLIEAEELENASKVENLAFDDGCRVNLLPERDSSQASSSSAIKSRRRLMPKSARLKNKAKKIFWQDPGSPDNCDSDYDVPDFSEYEDKLKKLKSQFPQTRIKCNDEPYFSDEDEFIRLSNHFNEEGKLPNIKVEANLDEELQNGDIIASSSRRTGKSNGGPKRRRGRPRKKWPSGDNYAYFSCSQCAFIAVSTEVLATHTKEFHSNVDDIEAKIKSEIKNDEWDGLGYDTSFLDSLEESSSSRPYSPSPKKKKKLGCDLCSYKADSQTLLDNHKDIKHGAKPQVVEYIKCSYCEEEIDRKKMEHHMFSRHKDIKLHICDMCPFKTNSLPNLTRHINNMHLAINIWPCPECPLKCGSPHSLKKHVDRIHKNIFNYMCELCSYRSATGSELRTHMDMKHTATDRFKCDKCDFATGLKRNLERHHIRVHSLVKAHACPMQGCGYQANEKGDIDKHVKRVHMGMRRYQCHMAKCEFKIDSKSKWLEHLAIEHRLGQTEIEDISLKRKRTRIGGAHRKAVLLQSSVLNPVQSPPFPSVVPRPTPMTDSSN